MILNRFALKNASSVSEEANERQLIINKRYFWTKIMDLRSLINQIDSIERGTTSFKQYINESVYNSPEMTAHWQRLDEGFFQSYNQYLEEVALSPEQIRDIFKQVAGTAQGDATKDTSKLEKIVDKVLPSSQAANLEKSLPEPDAGPVQGFEQKAASAVQNIQGVDSSTKQSIMQWVKTGLKKPETQQLILAALSAGLGGLISKAGPILSMIPGGGPVVSAVTGALVAGTLAVASAKMRGEDWKSAFKGAIKPALMGGASAVVGNLAANAIGALTGGGATSQDSGQKAPPEDFSSPSTQALMKDKGLDPSSPEDQKVWQQMIDSGKNVGTMPSMPGAQIGRGQYTDDGGQVTDMGLGPNKDMVKIEYPDGGSLMIKRSDLMAQGGTSATPPADAAATRAQNVAATTKYVDDPGYSPSDRRGAASGDMAPGDWNRMGSNKNPDGSPMTLDQINAAKAAQRAGNARESFTRLQITQLLSEGIFDFFKGGKKPAAAVTADSLMSAWQAAGSPTDSDAIKAFLTKQGVDAAAVDKAIASIGNQPAAPAAQAAAQPGAMKAADIVKDLDAAWSKITADQGSETSSPQVQQKIRAMAKNAGMAGQTFEGKYPKQVVGVYSKFLGENI